jgi:uncharacterized protein (TIRG00374 family)
MLVGIVIFAIYLYFFIGIPQIIAVITQVNSQQYIFYYTLALLSILASVLTWSVAWNLILRDLNIKITYRRAYLYYWVGYFTDLVIPCASICGELTRLYLVEQETKTSYGTLAASAITNRIVAYTIVIIGLYSGAVLIFTKPGVPAVIANIFIIFLIGVTIYAAVLLYLAFVKSAAENINRLYQKILKLIRRSRYQETQAQPSSQSLSNYYEGFRVFRENPKLLLKPFVFHLISYLLGLSTYVFIFAALGIPSPSPEFYIVVYFIATAVQDAAAAFSVGSLDIILASIFILYGLPPATSGIAALLLRSVGFWFPLFVGFASVQLLGVRDIVEHSQHLHRHPKTSEQPAGASDSLQMTSLPTRNVASAAALKAKQQIMGNCEAT